MKALIVGNGISGKSAYEFLKTKGYEVEFASDEMINNFDENLFKTELDRLVCGLSFVLKSPGISFENKLIRFFEKNKVKVIGELELSLANAKGDVIGVTGTNGKTTTVSLINFLLKRSKKRVFLGGNIGVPFSSFAQNVCENDVAVIEASSFQLEKIRSGRFHIASILNISPDHLNHHKNMREYIKAKQNITKYQTSNDYLILNADNEILMKNQPKTKAKIYYFSTQKKVEGCYVKNSCIYFNDNLKEIKLVSLDGLRLIGRHNLENVLCAVLAVFLETGDKKLLKGIKDFEGVPHRIEYVKTVKGVPFFNDSKATNIDSTNVALKSFSCGINLILGGSDKGYDFDKFFANLPKNIRNIAIFGQTRQKIAKSADKFNFKNYQIFDSLKSATRWLFDMAKDGEIVLLSPACASFDYFSNYVERGQVFKKIVEEISIYENAQNDNQEGIKI